MRIGIVLLCGTSVLLAGSSAGLEWDEPAGWRSNGSTSMRAATYTVQDAECIVYFFGEGQGGSIDANLTRWKDQFTVNGQPSPARTGKRTVHDLQVTDLDLTGTYEGMSGGNVTPQAPKPGTRMIAAIVEGPGGNIFVRFIGPAKTIETNRPKFDQLISSFRKK